MSYDFKDVNVLVVETAPPLFELIKGVLNLFTVPQKNISAAFDVDDAFRMFKERNHDLILVDWLQNPDRGITLTKMIRQHAETPNPFVPIIMMAGSGHLSRVLKARDAGVSEYLVKPFTAKELAKVISRTVESPRSFVMSDAFTGPDRRTGISKNYVGIERREQGISTAMPVKFSGDKTGS